MPEPPAGKAMAGTHPSLRAALEAPTEQGRLEWMVSQALATYNGQIETLLAEQLGKSGKEAAERADQSVGQVREVLGLRLDGLQKSVQDQLTEECFALKRQVAESQAQNTQKTLAEISGAVAEVQQHTQHIEAVIAQRQHDMMWKEVMKEVRDLSAEVKALQVPRLARRGGGSVGSPQLTRGSTKASTSDRVEARSPETECPAVTTDLDGSLGAVADRLSGGNGHAVNGVSKGVLPQFQQPQAPQQPADVSPPAVVLGFASPLPQSGNTKGNKAVSHWAKLGEMRVDALAAVQGWSQPRSKKDKPEISWLEQARLRTDVFSSVVVILNLLFMGAETATQMNYAKQGLESPSWLWWIDFLFALYFGFELALRFALEKGSFWYGQNWRWNMCDTILVFLQVLDLSFAMVNLSFLRVLRAMRTLRAIRIIRTITFIRELRLMIASISASLYSLLWAFVLLCLVLYVFSLGLEQTLAAHITSVGPAYVDAELLVYYGDLWETMKSLFMAISGGVDWLALVKPLTEISEAYSAFFILFIMLVLFGMLNILTAIFVESTKLIAEVDQELVIQEYMDRENSVVNKMREYLTTTADDDGWISKSDFEAKVMSQRFQAQLRLLALDVHEAEGVFNIMNIHGTDEVSIDEFMYGLIRLKGNAKAVDVVTMLYESRRITQMLTALMKYTENSFEGLRKDLGLVVPSYDLGTFLPRKHTEKSDSD